MPLNLEADSGISNPVHKAGLDSILVAMTEEEIGLFFGGSRRFRSAQGQYHVMTEEELEAGNWKAAFARTSARILLAAWRVPALPPEFLHSPACTLKYVSYAAGSVRSFLPRSFLERGGVATNWGETVASLVAEHALLLALAALRNMKAWPKAIGRAEPHERPALLLQTRTLRGRRVGLHGYGAVARALVDLLQPFGGSLYAYSQGVPAAAMARDGVVACGSLEELFRSSEVLFECEALRPNTRMTVTSRVVSCLPDGAVFVNVGRGQVVDEEALLNEARAQRIRIALDVIAQEPMNPTSPVMRVRDAILSPHIAGPTSDHYRRCGELALDNISRYITGQPLQGLVTLDIYDRST